jgi:hypothetical protein
MMTSSLSPSRTAMPERRQAQQKKKGSRRQREEEEDDITFSTIKFSSLASN